MRAAWLLLAIAACQDDSTVTPDAALPDADMDGVDVVVSSTGVQVWVGFTGTLGENDMFPAGGACTATVDTFMSAPTCFAGIDIDNIALDSGSQTTTPANPFTSKHPTTDSSMLSLSDCGRQIQIPLRAGFIPVATNVAATRNGSDVIVTWTSNEPQSISSVNNVTTEFDCHDGGVSQHRFVLASDTVGASVRPLSQPDAMQTSLGQVRVWYGDRTDITVPAP
jgi:hypothetical protein